MASTESRITTDIAEQEIKLMKKKIKAKSSFALSKNRHLSTDRRPRLTKSKGNYLCLPENELQLRDIDRRTGSAGGFLFR